LRNCVANPHPTDIVDALGELVIGDGGRELAQVDREVGELHLAGKDILQRAAATFRAIDRGCVAGDEGGAEERKALYVIPMRMSQEDARLDGLLLPGHQRGGQRVRPGTAVENQQVATREVVSSTHEVLPPKWIVLGPGVAIDPRVPQKRTLMSSRLLVWRKTGWRRDAAPGGWLQQ
jgi:hypothetical protein